MKHLLKSIKNYDSRFWFIKNKQLMSIVNALDNWRFVGGVVRDGYLNIHSYDIDISTTMLPDQVNALFPKITCTIGKRFGTVMVFAGKFTIEITTTRKDINQTGRHTDVLYTNDFFIDSCRRDFTINSLYCDSQYIYDYHNGLEDLKNGCVRFIGNPQERIQEDYLRILRYVRFFIRFSHNTYDKYEKVIYDNILGLKHVSWERVFCEVQKILCHDKYLVGLKMLKNYELFEKVYGFSIISCNMSEFNNEEKMAITMQHCNKLLPRKIKLIIKVIKMPLTLENLAVIWEKYKSTSMGKFLIKYNSYVLQNKQYDHLLDITWNYNYDTSHWVGPERGKVNYIVKLLFLKKIPITKENIDIYLQKQN